MMHLQVAERLCAICVRIPGDRMSLVGDRLFWVCEGCARPGTSKARVGRQDRLDTPRLRARILSILRTSPGTDGQAIREMLGIDPTRGNRISKLLERLWKDGKVTREGAVNHYRYYLAPAPEKARTS